MKGVFILHSLIVVRSLRGDIHPQRRERVPDWTMVRLYRSGNNANTFSFNIGKRGQGGKKGVGRRVYVTRFLCDPRLVSQANELGGRNEGVRALGKNF